MKPVAVALVFLLTAAALPQSPGVGPELEGSRVLVEIGDQKITRAEFLNYLKQINPLIDFNKLTEKEQHHYLNEFVSKKLFALKARAAGLDRMVDVRARIEFFTDSVLAQALKDSVMEKIKIAEEELLEYYQAHKKEFKIPPRLLLQHFLYRRAEKAARAREQLRQGATFSQLAAEKGKDLDLILVERNWFAPQLLISELSEAALALESGEVSEVLRSSYGYHVLRLEAREPGSYKEFAAARSEIAERLRRAKAGALYQQLLEEARREHPVRIRLKAKKGARS